MLNIPGSAGREVQVKHIFQVECSAACGARMSSYILVLRIEDIYIRVNGPHNVGDPHNAGLGK